MQERRVVDLAYPPLAVYQEHLEHMRELAHRAAARAVDGVAHVLAESLDQRHEVARVACGEEVPRQALILSHTALAVLRHRGGRVSRGVEAQRDEADLAG